MYCGVRFKQSLDRELPKNGDAPKSPLLLIGSLAPSVGTKLISKTELFQIMKTAGPAFG
jgi:hypothetical protein